MPLFNNPHQSPLLNLPPDIRNIIYAFVFTSPHGMHVDFDTDHPHPRGSSAWSAIPTFTSTTHGTALSKTCKFLYFETANLPFWLNTVHFHVPVLADLWSLRSAAAAQQQQNWDTAFLPRNCPTGLQKRVINIPEPDSSTLTSRCLPIRQKAQEFITLAMRLPHLDDIVTRLNIIVAQSRILDRLHGVHVHLGSQTNNVFLERFFTAWSEVLPALLVLAVSVNLRISFSLRMSRRLVVDYDFGARDPEKMLTEIDACVVVPYGGALTLPELTMVNAVRVRMWKAFCPAGEEEMAPEPLVPRVREGATVLPGPCMIEGFSNRMRRGARI